MSTQKEEPILEDVRDKLQRILSYTYAIDEDIDNLHYRLDKNLASDLPHSDAKTEPTPLVPNLRFDMNKLADKSLETLESIMQNIASFKNKMVDLRTKAAHP